VGGAGIRVSIVEPGATQTEVAGGISDPVMRAAMTQHVGKAGAMQPSDIAEAIVFIASLPARANVSQILIRTDDRYRPDVNTRARRRRRRRDKRDKRGRGNMLSTTEVEPPAEAPREELPGLGYRSYFLLIMVLLSACVVAERYILFVLVEPIRHDLHLSDFQIGLVKDLVLAIVYVLAVIPLAHLSDRWSRKRIVAIAALAWTVSVVVCSAAKGFWVMLLGRAGIGLGEGAFTPPSQAWIADLFPPKQRGTALSIFLLGASIGAFAGPALGGWAAHEYGWRNALLLASIPGLILAPIVWFTLRDVRAGLADGNTTAPSERKPFLEVARELMAIRTFPLLVVASALNTLMTMGLISWAPAFIERTHGMPAREAGMQMGSALFVGSLIGPPAGRPARRPARPPEPALVPVAADDQRRGGDDGRPADPHRPGGTGVPAVRAAIAGRRVGRGPPDGGGDGAGPGVVARHGRGDPDGDHQRHRTGRRTGAGRLAERPAAPGLWRSLAGHRHALVVAGRRSEHDPGLPRQPFLQGRRRGGPGAAGHGVRAVVRPLERFPT
jgi:predicted MFS family arabinose efflux permease